jgi:hypothetical protein
MASKSVAHRVHVAFIPELELLIAEAMGERKIPPSPSRGAWAGLESEEARFTMAEPTPAIELSKST